jgi:hypothetical protein
MVEKRAHGDRPHRLESRRKMCRGFVVEPECAFLDQGEHERGDERLRDASDVELHRPSEWEPRGIETGDRADTTPRANRERDGTRSAGTEQLRQRLLEPGFKRLVRRSVGRILHDEAPR